MGQKVHPYGFRLGYTKVWRSRWYAQKGYADLVNEDINLKQKLRTRLKAAGISSIELDRPGNKLRIAIRAARPGIIIGKRGSEIEKLKAELQEQTKREIYIDIQEVHRPELDAQLVAESVAIQIEKRVSFRRAMRKAVEFAQRFGCKGIKIWVAGRLNALARPPAVADLARGHRLRFQRGPHDLRSDRRQVLDLQGRDHRSAASRDWQLGTGRARAGAAGRGPDASRARARAVAPSGRARDGGARGRCPGCSVQARPAAARRGRSPVPAASGRVGNGARAR